MGHSQTNDNHKSVVLHSPFADAWSPDSVFEQVRALQGDSIRDKEGRRTIRFVFQGESYYLKHHTGVGWREIFKAWSQLKRPVTGAENEWLAINRVGELGLDTLDAVAFGQRGRNPAKRESFLITRELTGIFSLAKFAEPWPQQPPPVALKRRLIDKVAIIAREIHRHGINHRDLYICHFLLDLNSLEASEPRLHLVDLHRAQIRDRVPRRWLVKDLASIYFSAMDVGLTRRDVYRFLKIYFQQPLREVLTDRRALLKSVQRRAIQLYRRDFGCDPQFQLPEASHD